MTLEFSCEIIHVSIMNELSSTFIGSGVISLTERSESSISESGADPKVIIRTTERLGFEGILKTRENLTVVVDRISCEHLYCEVYSELPYSHSFKKVGYDHRCNLYTYSFMSAPNKVRFLT